MSKHKAKSKQNQREQLYIVSFVCIVCVVAVFLHSGNGFSLNNSNSETQDISGEAIRFVSQNNCNTISDDMLEGTASLKELRKAYRQQDCKNLLGQNGPPYDSDDYYLVEQCQTIDSVIDYVLRELRTDRKKFNSLCAHNATSYVCEYKGPGNSYDSSLAIIVPTQATCKRWCERRAMNADSPVAEFQNCNFYPESSINMFNLGEAIELVGTPTNPDP